MRGDGKANVMDGEIDLLLCVECTNWITLQHVNPYNHRHSNGPSLGRCGC